MFQYSATCALEVRHTTCIKLRKKKKNLNTLWVLSTRKQKEMKQNLIYFTYSKIIVDVMHTKRYPKVCLDYIDRGMRTRCAFFLYVTTFEFVAIKLIDKNIEYGRKKNTKGVSLSINFLSIFQIPCYSCEVLAVLRTTK